VWSRTHTWRHVALPEAGRPRVSSSSVRPAPLVRPTAHKACTRHATRHAAPRATSTGGTAKRNAPRTRRRTTTGHEDKATSAPWPGRGRSSPPRQLVANAPPATDEQREKPAPPAPPRAWACERMRLREIDTATGTVADAAAGTAADTIDAVAQDTDRPTQHKLERKLQQTRTDSNKLERACSPADRRRRHAQMRQMIRMVQRTRRVTAGVAVAVTVLSRLRRPIVWALYCGITINDYTRPRPQSTESTVYLDATN